MFHKFEALSAIFMPKIEYCTALLRNEERFICISGGFEMDKKCFHKTVDDAVCRIHRSAGFTLLSNGFVRSTNLQCSAIGLLGKVMSLPPSWNFTKAGISAICGDGITAVESALKELEAYGYVRITRQMPDESPTGRIRYVYDFFEYSDKDDSVPKHDVVLETFTADNATLNRVKKDGNFTIISNKLLQNREMKLKLLGFLLKVLSLPNRWQFSMSGLTKICKEGKIAVRSAVNKLIELGYLVRTKLLPNETASNTFEYVYEFFEKPLSADEAQEHETETRRKALAVRQGKSPSAEVEKQQLENLPLDSQVSVELPSVKPVQYIIKDTTQNNTKQNNKKSIIPSGQKPREGLTDCYKESEVRAYTEIVREAIDYLKLCAWLCEDGRDGFAEADEIVGFIVDEICSPLPYTKIKGCLYPRSVVKSVLLRANIHTVENALEQMAEVDRIKDHRRYFISTLFGEVQAYRFKDNCGSRWAERAVQRDFGVITI